MKMLARAGLALLALFACLPADAQHATTSIAYSGYAPEQACVTWSGASIGSGSLIPCGTGSGGGGGGSNAAAASTGATAGAFASQTGYVGSDGKVYNWVGDLLGHPAVSIFGTVSVSGTVAATQSGSWTIANTSFGISGTLPAFAAPPTVAPLGAASGKITETDVALTTGTNTSLAAVAANRVGIKIQCSGGPVKVSETGATLTSAAIGTGPSGGILPTTNTAYTPLEASQTAYTAFQSTGSTVTCAVTDYRQ